MVIGDRVVVGDIKERQQAKAIYEQAKRNGQTAALTEQERPNIFTNSVANIGPGETVLVQIEYQEPVHQSGNEFSLRVPMVVAPRYNPAPIVQNVEFKQNGGGWGATAADPVPDRDRISPEVLDPAKNPPVNPTAITVRLQAGDRFNVIRFDDSMTVLFPRPVPADAEHVGSATAFVRALQAAGGTEMVPAMRAALSDTNREDASYVRQVVFLTYGAIGNEQQLFETIAALRGRSRVFMVGIGSAPNTFLMTRASELGRGAFTHIGSVEQVEERMRGLFSKLENPAVTGLTVKFSEADADVTPAIIPDVYRDEPLVLAAKLDKLAGSLEIKGRVGD